MLRHYTEKVDVVKGNPDIWDGKAIRQGVGIGPKSFLPAIELHLD
jgi:hypothetical protein